MTSQIELSRRLVRLETDMLPRTEKVLRVCSGSAKGYNGVPCWLSLSLEEQTKLSEGVNLIHMQLVHAKDSRPVPCEECDKGPCSMQ